jgi:hypothetical protein
VFFEREEQERNLEEEAPGKRKEEASPYGVFL